MRLRHTLTKPHDLAILQLRGILHVINKSAAAIPAMVVTQLVAMTREAIDQLLKPDPDRDKLEFYTLRLLRSVDIEALATLDMDDDEVPITDRLLYRYGFKKLAELCELEGEE